MSDPSESAAKVFQEIPQGVMCLICRSGGTYPDHLNGMELFDEGWFHTKAAREAAGISRVIDCRGDYEEVVEWLRPRTGFNAGTERWQEYLDENPDYNPITSNVGPGWIGLVVKLTQALRTIHSNGEFNLHQLKEKFGGMRFYVDGSTDLGWTIIGWAESMSYKYCEECGQFGEVRGDGWLKTLCDDHWKARQEARRIQAEKQAEKMEDEE